MPHPVSIQLTHYIGPLGVFRPVVLHRMLSDQFSSLRETTLQPMPSMKVEPRSIRTTFRKFARNFSLDIGENFCQWTHLELKMLSTWSSSDRGRTKDILEAQCSLEWKRELATCASCKRGTVGSQLELNPTEPFPQGCQNGASTARGSLERRVIL